MAIVVAARPKLRWWHRLYFPVVLMGMAITLRHMFRKKVTMQFPEVKWPYPAKYRGYPKLVMGEDNIPKCVACKLCEIVCPPVAITIKIGEYADQDQRERFPDEFMIDMGRCILCGMCEEACPVDAIVMSDVHVMSTSAREKIVFRKEELLSDYHQMETMR